jgi:hypothetical protein
MSILQKMCAGGIIEGMQHYRFFDEGVTEIKR